MIFKWLFDRVLAFIGLLFICPSLLIVAMRISLLAMRDVLKLCPGIIGPATLKYRLEDEMIFKYVAEKLFADDSRPMQEITVEYNDTVIYTREPIVVNKYIIP